MTVDPACRWQRERRRLSGYNTEWRKRGGMVGRKTNIGVSPTLRHCAVRTPSGRSITHRNIPTTVPAQRGASGPSINCVHSALTPTYLSTVTHHIAIPTYLPALLLQDLSLCGPSPNPSVFETESTGWPSQAVRFCAYTPPIEFRLQASAFLSLLQCHLLAKYSNSGACFLFQCTNTDLCTWCIFCRKRSKL